MKMSVSGFTARALVLAALFTGSALEPATAGSETVLVALDRARIIRVPEGTQTLIVGNPLVADVTLLKNNQSMVITGRSFGATNMIALDASGNPVAESTIKVTANDQSVIVMRGGLQQSYSCNPRCAPTVTLGDEPKFMNETIGAARSRNSASAAGGK